MRFYPSCVGRELLDFVHRLRSAPLSGAGGERDDAGHRQPMPVFHLGVAHLAELRLPPGRLAVAIEPQWGPSGFFAN